MNIQTYPSFRTRMIKFLFFIICFFSIQSFVIGQVVADFEIDSTVGCTPSFTIHVINTGSSTGPEYEYQWFFEGTEPLSGDAQEYTYVTPGEKEIKLVVTNTSNSEKDSLIKSVTVILTPPAILTIDSTNVCVNENVELISNSVDRDSAHWIFGDGTIITSFGTVRNMYHSYAAHGNYDVQYITYKLQCSDTSILYPIVVDGPIANFTINPESACKGESIEFTMTADFDVSDFTWDLGENDIQTISPAFHVYDTMGDISVNLFVSGATGNCLIESTLHIYEVIPDFDFPESRCHQLPVFLSNNSTGDIVNHWDFGNGNTSSARAPAPSFSAGEYTVKLIIENDENCSDSLEKQLVVNALPEILIGDDVVICPGEAGQLEVSGGHEVIWTPATGLDNPTSYTPSASSEADTTIYKATITDTLTHCSSFDEVAVIKQQGFIIGKISVFPTDSSIIIGDTVVLSMYDTLDRDLSFEWTPDNWISCTDCPITVVQPLETTTYTLTISDTNKCDISEVFDFVIDVTEEYEIGVPEAFTPNGDQINDKLKVDGWGIKELIEFRIYNRGGKEIFFSDDINTGWDGYYEGKLQMTGTYVYLIKAENWDDNITTKRGTFSLLR